MLTSTTSKSSRSASSSSSPTPSHLASSQHAPRSFVTRALFGDCPDNVCVLYGLRTLCTLCVVLGHVYFIGSIMLDTPRLSSLKALDPDSSAFSREVFICAMALANCAVDIFLFLSSFLLTSTICTTYSSPRFITTTFVGRYMLFRWVRLIPLYLTLVALWGTVGGVESCVSMSELLFMRNVFVDYAKPLSQHQFCLGHGWFVHVDFQAHLLTLTVLSFASSWRHASHFVLALCALLTVVRSGMWMVSDRPVSTASSLVHVIPDPAFLGHIADTLGLTLGNASNLTGLHGISNNNSSVIGGGGVGGEMSRVMMQKIMFVAARPFYFATVYRAPVSLIGGWFGIAFAQRGKHDHHVGPITATHRLGTTRRKKQSGGWHDDMSCMLCMGCLMLALAFYVSGFRVPFDGQSDAEAHAVYRTWWYTAYQCMGSSFVAAGVGTLVMAVCDSDNSSSSVKHFSPSSSARQEDSDDGKGDRVVQHVIRRILGNKLLVGLSRSCYAVYLFHVMFFGAIAGVPPRLLSRDSFTFAGVLATGVKVYVVTVVLCVPVCIIEEACLGIRKRLILRLQAADRRDERRWRSRGGRR